MRSFINISKGVHNIEQTPNADKMIPLSRWHFGPEIKNFFASPCIRISALQRFYDQEI